MRGSSWLYANGHADGTTSCGRGLCNNRNSTMSIQSCSSNLDETFNSGMMNRQMKMVNATTIKNGKENTYRAECDEDDNEPTISQMLANVTVMEGVTFTKTNPFQNGCKYEFVRKENKRIS